jgi:carbonic anhydrase
MLKKLAQGNKKFQTNVFAPKGLEKLKDGQQPHSCWIGCSDSRVPAGLITHSGAGELFVHRNVANMIPVDDPSVGSVLEYAVDHLNVQNLVICGHYGCGGVTALWRGPHEGTYVEAWLRNGSEALKRVLKIKGIKDMPEEKALKLLVEENLRVQREHALKYKFVRSAVKKGKLEIHAVIYDIVSGKLKELKD